MTDRWDELNSIFQEAVRLPEADRAEWLDRRCAGQADLRAEVDALLAADRAVGSTPTVDAPAERRSNAGHGLAAGADLPSVSLPGYEVTRLLSRGGQGAVYQAVQTSTKRKVAIKVLLDGEFASPSVRRRFEREVELVAQLKHPNIISIFDSGQTAEGRQYAVMDYVRGVPLTRYVRDNDLTLEDALRLFNKVLDAVQYAHRKGVIHRDLKPGNILVDADGSPRVLDFGLAKQMLGTTDTVITMTEQVVGTLPYMSPEQTTGNPDLIDTRTDVYALGVILYELLTGTYPYPVVGQLAAVLKHIAETDPTPPSRSWQTGSGISRRSGRRKQRVGGCPIDDELQTITLKLLSKDRARRYQSAGELREDIEHYLAGEPIQAKKDSGWYLLRKAMRRYRVPVAVLSVLVLLISASTVALSILYQRAERQRIRADRESAEAVAAANLADQRYQEIIRLADLKRLADARSAADRLWPAHPGKIEKMQAWLVDEAAPLRENLPLHEATLASLRTRALPYDAAQQRADRQGHPRAVELADLRQRLDALRRQVSSDREADGSAAAGDERRAALNATIARTEQEIADLEEVVGERRTWLFPDDQTQWQHDALAGLVADLRAFVDPASAEGTVASVGRRLSFAKEITDRSVSCPEAASRWTQAIADVARLEVYGGLQLEPQIGLLPLRRDPRSGLWEFWHVQTGAAPAPNPDPEAANPWILTGDTGLVFVLIPGGEFWMGAQRDDPAGRNYDPQAEESESPVHQVSLDAFFLSKYEMTQAQWQRFTRGNPSRYGPNWHLATHRNTPCNPVEQASWSECQEVLTRLGLVFPTEAQWEYAARAGTRTPWWIGTEKAALDTERAGNLADAWARDNGGPASWSYEDWEDNWLVHAPVGTFAANGFGLHDVTGNVWEWCRDTVADYDAEVASGDGLRRPAPGARLRLYRGGSFSDPAADARSAHRVGSTPANRDSNLGLRPARRLSD